MAQLPPKIPTDWPPNTNHHHHLPRHTSMASFFPSSHFPAVPSQPSWIDEFFDFSFAKRGDHRRAMRDSVAIFKSVIAPTESFHIASTATADPDSFSSFDRLDVEQLMPMLSDNVLRASSAATSLAPSTPSDHNSINDNEPDLCPPDRPACSTHENPEPEAQSSFNTMQLLAVGTNATPASDSCPQPIVDPKRVKRILANRKSAQRSRVRKLQYISELERSVTPLQTEVSALSSRVALLDHQRSILTVGNSHLKQRIAAIAQDNIFKDARQEALKKEIERLRKTYQQQKLKKMAAKDDSH